VRDSRKFSQVALLKTCSCMQAITAAGKRKNTLVAAFSVDMWSLGMLAYDIFQGYATPFVNEKTTTLHALCMHGRIHTPGRRPCLLQRSLDAGICSSFRLSMSICLICGKLKLEAGRAKTSLHQCCLELQSYESVCMACRHPMIDERLSATDIAEVMGGKHGLPWNQPQGPTRESLLRM